VETGTHLLSAGGKRIRPILTLLSAAAVGAGGEDARRLACAGELVHLATLLHDDVIDNADTRRGQSTPRVVWSNTASVLGGDYALTRALDLVSLVPTMAPLREAVATLRSLVEGEIVQLSYRGTVRMTVSAYQDLIELKTASLFRWCCRAGGHLGGDPSVVTALGTYGTEIGACFQIVDDILDFNANEEAFGKALLTDLADGKLTLPVLLAMESDPSLREALDALVADPDARLQRIAPVVLTALRETGALTRARERAQGHAAAAIEAVRAVDASPYRSALETIAGQLSARAR